MIFCSETNIFTIPLWNGILPKRVCYIGNMQCSTRCYFRWGKTKRCYTYPRNYFTSRWKSSGISDYSSVPSPWLLQSVKINFDSSGDFERRSVILRKFALNISIFRTFELLSIKTFETVSVSSGASLRDSEQLRFSWN